MGATDRASLSCHTGVGDFAAANTLSLARSASSGFRATRFISKLASSCSLFVLSLPFEQDFLPAIVLRGLFNFAQLYVGIVLGKSSSHPITLCHG
jgi:hypothetical protein